MASVEFRDVAQLLTCRQFAEAEGLRMQGGRLQCPFHGGRHFNLAIWNDGRRVYCHKCHRGGDVVALAAAVWHMSQRDAAIELNARFKLGLNGERLTATELERRRRDREAARQDEAEARAAQRKLYADAADELREAEAALEKFDATADWTPAVTAAVHRLAAAQDRWHNLTGGR